MSLRCLSVSLLASLLLFDELASVNALHLSLEGHRRESGPNRVRSSPRWSRRDTGQTTLSNDNDVGYYANISLGGSEYKVLLDTGSSDLWVAGDPSSSTDTGKTAGVNYAVGSVEGSVKTASLEFAGYTVSDQAYLQATPSDDNPSGQGLIGLGPNSGSNVFFALGQDDSGEAVIDRIFKQNTSTSNYVTVLLGRSDDPTDSYPGDVTVGELLPGWENISSQSQLSVSQVSIYNQGDQHWQALLDADGVIGPDGKPVSVTTNVNTTSNPKQLTAIFDTGFTLPQVPSAVAKAFYGNVDGAQLVNSSSGSQWTVPCAQEINVTFRFGGTSYPIHPLDMSTEDSSLSDGTCYGTFQPITDDAQSDLYDMILGMAFLRNVYMLINYGDFVDGSKSTTSPYIQLLSTTNDTTQAHNDFIDVRSQSSSEDARVTRIRLIVGIVAGVLVAGALALYGISQYKRKRNEQLAKQGRNSAVFSRGQYAPLGGHAPPMAMDSISPYPPYAPPRYYNPADAPSSGGVARPPASVQPR